MSAVAISGTPLTSQDTQRLKKTIAELREMKQEKSSKSGKPPFLFNV